ncbi:hypothetical protein Mp_7g12420 [Marchantia polymorpha subsp. ruderalis]|uniref:Uncharacterized protein n=2 Tax=Marchantia polymorpha TaxID=3197 RepID=A0AAF6BYS2_MARPO|nr:hypothetical protein MARPO_0003s0251 [Marchantia polymorpha]BBN17156.1 hypothetical protein Mp_7g12420 [Marchantia polymorpha subsp. ruderalis]|eukprot:PTQ49391.1 hypothetical protein MARPO_0003s0251 [Marchantia polymorpha]
MTCVMQTNKSQLVRAGFPSHHQLPLVSNLGSHAAYTFQLPLGLGILFGSVYKLEPIGGNIRKILHCICVPQLKTTTPTKTGTTTTLTQISTRGLLDNTKTRRRFQHH